ncbi:hypothetical protein [[Phormidium] sp. ETS-05]|nr:hypothetical protein [[Phormidium] sp. ETS-05]
MSLSRGESEFFQNLPKLSADYIWAEISNITQANRDKDLQPSPPQI